MVETAKYNEFRKFTELQPGFCAKTGRTRGVTHCTSFPVIPVDAMASRSRLEPGASVRPVE